MMSSYSLLIYHFTLLIILQCSKLFLNLFEVRLELVHLAVEFLDETVALAVLAKVEEAEVVLVCLEFVGEDVLLTEETLADAGCVTLCNVALELVDTATCCVLVGSTVETIHLLTESLEELVLLLEWHVTYLVPLVLCLTELLTQLVLEVLRVDGCKALDD